MGFILKIGSKSKDVYNPSVRDVNVAIDDLDLDTANKNPFIVLDYEDTDEKDYLIFLQVFSYGPNSKNISKYLLEFHYENRIDFKHYRQIFREKKKIKKFFEDFLLDKKWPNFSNWEDITQEIRDYYKTQGTFSIFHIAKTSHRAKKEINNCHNYFHGAKLKKTIIYQHVAEAIVLCKMILKSNGSLGEIYYTKNKRLVYMDILFPKHWQAFIPDVYRVRGKISDAGIYIACYNNEGLFVKADIKPLPTHEKLLACLLLVFVKTLLVDEELFFTVMNYLCTSKKELFDTIYTELMVKQEASSYSVIYNPTYNDDDDDEDQDEEYFSNYLPFSNLYRNFLENFKK